MSCEFCYTAIQFIVFIYLFRQSSGSVGASPPADFSEDLPFSDRKRKRGIEYVVIKNSPEISELENRTEKCYCVIKFYFAF